MDTLTNPDSATVERKSKVTVAGIEGSVALFRDASGFPVAAIDDCGNLGIRGLLVTG